MMGSVRARRRYARERARELADKAAWWAEHAEDVPGNDPGEVARCTRIAAALAASSIAFAGVR